MNTSAFGHSSSRASLPVKPSLFPNPASPSRSCIPRSTRSPSPTSPLTGLRRTKPLPKSLDQATSEDFESIEHAFQRCDGFLTFPDFFDLIRTIIDLDLDSCHHLFESIDVANSGKIGWLDFCSYTSSLYDSIVNFPPAFLSSSLVSPTHQFTREVNFLYAYPHRNLVLSCGADSMLRVFPCTAPSLDTPSIPPRAVIPPPNPPSEVGRPSLTTGCSSKIEQDLIRVSVSPACHVSIGQNYLDSMEKEWDSRIAFALGEDLSNQNSQSNFDRTTSFFDPQSNVTSSSNFSPSKRPLLRYSRELSSSCNVPKYERLSLTQSKLIKKSHKSSTKIQPDSDLLNIATASASFEINRNTDISSTSISAKSYGAWATSAVGLPSLSSIYVSTLSSSFLVLSEDHLNISNHFRIPRIALTMSSIFDPITSSRFVYGDTAGFLCLWDAKLNLITKVSQPHPKAFVTASVFAFPNTFFSAGNDGSLCLSDLDNLALVRSYNLPSSRSIYCLDHHSRIHLAAYGGLDRRIGLVDPYVDKPIHYLEGHSSPVLSVSFAENSSNTGGDTRGHRGLIHPFSGSMLISTSIDKVIKVWDLRMMKEVQTVIDDCRHIPTDEIKSSTFMPGSSSQSNLIGTVITGGSTLRFWPLSVNQEVTRSQSIIESKSRIDSNPFPSQIIAFLFLTALDCWCAVHVDGILRIFQVNFSSQSFNQTKFLKLANIKGIITSASVENGGKLVVIASSTGNVYFVHSETGSIVSSLPSFYGDVCSLCELPPITTQKLSKSRENSLDSDSFLTVNDVVIDPSNNSNISSQFFGTAAVGSKGLVAFIPKIDFLVESDCQSTPALPVLMPEVHSDNDVTSIGWVSSINRLITADTFGALCLWDLVLRQVDYSFNFPSGIICFKVLDNPSPSNPSPDLFSTPNPNSSPSLTSDTGIIDVIVCTERSSSNDHDEEGKRSHSLGAELWHLQLRPRQNPIAYCVTLLPRSILCLSIFNSRVAVIDSLGIIIVLKMTVVGDTIRLHQVNRLKVDMDWVGGMIVNEDGSAVVYGSELCCVDLYNQS
ncbi:hypothetical protein RCL1_000084 [Eukaryota sp. TZLM3-RCL]